VSEGVGLGWAQVLGTCCSSSDSSHFLLLQSEGVAQVGGCGVGVGPGSGVGGCSSGSSHFLLLQSEGVAQVGGSALSTVARLSTDGTFSRATGFASAVTMRTCSLATLVSSGEKRLWKQVLVATPT
jgi:hypothetical protein